MLVDLYASSSLLEFGILNEHCYIAMYVMFYMNQLFIKILYTVRDAEKLMGVGPCKQKERKRERETKNFELFE